MVLTKLLKIVLSIMPQGSYYSCVATKVEGHEFLRDAYWVDADKFAKV